MFPVGPFFGLVVREDGELEDYKIQDVNVSYPAHNECLCLNFKPAVE